MRQFILAAAGLTAILAVAPTAEAGTHGHTTRVQGAWGRGYVHSRQVSRQPGSVAVSRGTQTNAGYGVAAQRNASWGDGAYNGGGTRTRNNGQSASRATSVVNNGDGSYSYSASQTGYNGGVRSVSGTVNRP